MTLLEKAIECLCNLEDKSFRRNNDGRVLDEAIKLVNFFLTADEDSKTQLKELISGKSGRFLIGLTSELCAKAIDEKSR